MDEDVLERPQQRSLWERFPGMRPLEQLPTLYQVLGTGTAMVGQRDPDAETNSYLASHCFTLLYLPVWTFGAYRVQPCPPGGYLFLGRASLSSLTPLMNLLSLLVLCVAVGGGTWWGLFGASEARARTELDLIESLITQGRLAEAGERLAQMITPSSPASERARERLTDLLQNADGPATEMAGLLAVGARLEAEGNPLVRNLFQRGYEYADKRVKDDPIGGLKVLDAVADLSARLGGLETLERRLLEEIVRQNPNDVNHVSRLAALYMEEGELDRARPLLEPLRAQLGTGEGSIVLGKIDLQEERYEEAVALLRPAVQARIARHQQLMERRDKEQQDAVNRIFQTVWDRKADGLDYAEYDRADQARKHEMALEYLNQVWPDQHRARVSARALERDGLTRTAAQALGQAEAHLAQKLPDPTAREEAMRKAEATFRSIEESGRTRSNEDRLRMARAYYWVGKPVHGRALLDEVLQRRRGRPELVESVARVLRNVGAVSDARQVLEDAYAADDDIQSRFSLAFYRSLCATDLDDRLLWLERSALNRPDVRVSLLQAQSLKAREQGKDDEAIKLCHEALKLYAGMEVNGATLNNSALVYFDLYELEHDLKWFKEGVSRMERALKDYPGSEVILRNVANSLLAVANADAAGGEIDFQQLQARPSGYFLAYLFADRAGQQKSLARLRDHADLPRVRGHLNRLLLLAPRRTDVYAQLVRLYEQLGDESELRRLYEKLERTEVDTADAMRESREVYERKKDEKNRTEQQHAIARARKALEECRRFQGPTHAAAAGRLASLLMHKNIYEVVDPDEVVALAEEAHTSAPSEATSNMLTGALIFRAQQRLRRENLAFAALCRRTERAMGTFLVNWVMVNGGTFRAKLLANEDIQRAQAIRLEQLRTFPEGRGLADWSLLVASHPREAEVIAQRIRKRNLERYTTAIDLKLSPLNGSAIVMRAMYLHVDGKPGEAGQLMADKISEGVPLPGGR